MQVLQAVLQERQRAAAQAALADQAAWQVVAGVLAGLSYEFGDLQALQVQQRLLPHHPGHQPLKCLS